MKLVFPSVTKPSSLPPTHPQTSKSKDAQDDPTFTYRKLLRLNIPKQAIRYKMKKDMIDPSIIQKLLGDDPESSSSEGEYGMKDLSCLTNKQRSKLISLHWTPLSPESIEQTVWSTTS